MKKNRIKCNCCGQIVEDEQALVSLRNETGKVPDAMAVMEITWGYFSRKDGEKHKIILCESCYDSWICKFQIPVEVTQTAEML